MNAVRGELLRSLESASAFAMVLWLALATLACAPRAARPSPAAGEERAVDMGEEVGAIRTIAVEPLPGWPRWLGSENHQISGLAYRDGHLYAAPDQSGVLAGALLEIGPLPPDDPASAAPAEGDPEGARARPLEVRVHCRWQGGPHPDAEGLALAPSQGPPRTAFMTFEAQADALVEIGFDDCSLRSQAAPLTGSDSNEGIEGIALSPDGGTVYLVHETEGTLLVLPRPGPGPARRIARIPGAHSLCDAAYDDRGTPAADDDRLLLLDRNARQIFDVTTSGRIVGRWRLDRDALARDPEGHPYGLVALEALAIASRDSDGALVVYAATDSPPRPLPYSRRGPDDTAGFYARRVGMLYKFRLSPFE